MADKQKKQTNVIPLTDDTRNINVHTREVPQTFWQRADQEVTDMLTFIKKWWWKVVILLGIVFVLALLVYNSSNPSFGVAFTELLKDIGLLLLKLLSWGSKGLLAFIGAFIAALWLSKRLQGRKKIVFMEFRSMGGGNMRTFNFRRHEKEVLMFEDLGNPIKTLFFKKKVKVDFSTWSLFEKVGYNDVTLYIDNNKYEVLLVYVFPREETESKEPMIIPSDKDEQFYTFNTEYIPRSRDIEEYILKSQIDGVDKNILFRTLINLTQEMNRYRTRLSQVEADADRKIEQKFFYYLEEQTPADSFGKSIIRNIFKKDHTEDLSDNEARFVEEYRQYLERMKKQNGEPTLQEEVIHG